MAIRMSVAEGFGAGVAAVGVVSGIGRVGRVSQQYAAPIRSD
jgi:hypothetical protein